MKTCLKYLGIIPARKGSTRVKNKNMTLINGKPLIYWSVLYAQKSKKLDSFIITTDDEEIIKYGYEYLGVGCMRRNKELAKDLTSLPPVLKDVSNRIEADNYVTLRPTSPIRVNNIIDKAIFEFENAKVDSLCTGFMNKEYPAFTIEDTPSQLLDGWFQNNGCVEIHKYDVIANSKSYGKKTHRLPVDQIYNYEVDTKLDFVIVEAIMKDLGIE